LLLAKGNAELFVGAQDLRVDLVERLRPILLLRRGVVVDVLIVDRTVFDLGPFPLAAGGSALIGVEHPRQHPFGLALLRRNEPDGVFAKALRGLLRFNQRLESILILIDVDTAELVDGLFHCRPYSLRSRFQGPRVGFVGYGPVPASGLSVPGYPPKRHRSPW